MRKFETCSILVSSGDCDGYCREIKRKILTSTSRIPLKQTFYKNTIVLFAPCWKYNYNRKKLYVKN